MQTHQHEPSQLRGRPVSVHPHTADLRVPQGGGAVPSAPTHRGLLILAPVSQALWPPSTARDGVWGGHTKRSSSRSLEPKQV